MTDDRNESLQNPLTHVGAPPEGRDSNEDADDKAKVAEPRDEDVEQ